MNQSPPWCFGKSILGLGARQKRMFIAPGVLAACILAVPVRTLAAESPSPAPKQIGPPDLVGEWSLKHDSPSVCRTGSFVIQTPRSAEAGPERLLAVEERYCSGDRRYVLNYYGQLFLENGRFLVSLNPPPPNDPVRAIDPIRSSTVVGYTPDRLTLWLSLDGCELIGSRKDTRGVDTTMLAIRKVNCH
jgi:hypothetical protein